MERLKERFTSHHFASSTDTETPKIRPLSLGPRGILEEVNPAKSSLSALLVRVTRCSDNIYVAIIPQRSNGGGGKGWKRQRPVNGSLNDNFGSFLRNAFRQSPPVDARVSEVRLASPTPTRDEAREDRPGSAISHRPSNLTDLWFDDRLPRQRSSVPGPGLESHLRELR